MSYILLASARDDLTGTRTFRDYVSTDLMVRAIIDHFELYKTHNEKIELEKRGIPVVLSDCLEYRSEELYEFMDTYYAELVCLVKDEESDDLWIPQTIDWIKETIQLFLRRHTGKDDASASGVTQMEVGGD